MHWTFPTLLIVALAACGDRAAAGSLRIALEVTEGPHAGRYRARGGGAACIRDAAVPGSVAVRFTDPDPNAALSSLQLVATSNGDFYLGVLFGGFRMDGRRHEIETRSGKPPLGSGSAVVSRRRSMTVLDVRGRTGDGMPLAVRIRCSGPSPGVRSGT